jgi:hypothetical protein
MRPAACFRHLNLGRPGGSDRAQFVTAMERPAHTRPKPSPSPGWSMIAAAGSMPCSNA